MRRFLFSLLVLASVGTVQAQTLGLRLDRLSAQVGDTVEVMLHADTSLTGRTVLAYRVGITFDDRILVPLAVESAGTLSSGASVTSRLLPRRVEVAAAAAQPLAGTGALLRLRFAVVGPGTSALSFDRPFTYVNEGDPAVAFTDGSVAVAYPPSLYVSGLAEMVRGETLDLRGSGGTPPYAWRSETPSVATVAADGRVTAVAPGTAQLVMQDANGYEKEAEVIVRAFDVRVGATPEVSVGDTLRVPLLLSALGAPGASAGRIRVGFNEGALDVLGVEHAATLLDGAQVALHRTPGRADLAFASAAPVTGDGPLVWLIARVMRPGTQHLDLQEARFDETLVGRLGDGSVTVRYPSQLSLYAPQNRVVAGDSLQLQLSGAVGAVTFTLSDPSLATVTPGGLLRVKRGGRLVVTAEDPTGAKVSTNPIDLYDARLRLQVPSVAAGDQGGVVLYLDPLPAGRTLSSLQVALDVTGSVLEIVGSTAPSGVQAAHRVDGPRVTVAVAAPHPVTDGPLATLVVQARPGTTGQTAYLRFSSASADEGAIRLLPVDDTLIPVAVAQTSTTPVLAWAPLQGTNTYQVQIATQGTFETSGKTVAVVLDTVVTGASFKVPAGVLASGATYEWRLRDAEAASTPWQPTRLFETRPAPAAVQLVSPAAGTADVALPATLAWQALPDVMGYDVQVGRHSLDTLVVDARVTETTLQAENLAPGTPYVWRVRAVNADGPGAWSATFRFTTRVVVVRDEEEEGAAFALVAPWPSPAQGRAQVRFAVPAGQPFALRLFDASGRLLQTLASGTSAGGAQAQTVDVAALPSGLYLLRLDGAGVQTQPLVVVR